MSRVPVLFFCLLWSTLAGRSAGEVVSMDSITITTVFDNEAFEEGLESSWGFSCLVQGLEKTILFDTGGEGEILLGNMERLGLDPGTIEVVILSHFHADHTGGLTDLLNAIPRATVYLLETFPDQLKREFPADTILFGS